jgi:hypothetical protein
MDIYDWKLSLRQDVFRHLQRGSGPEIVEQQFSTFPAIQRGGRFLG